MFFVMFRIINMQTKLDQEAGMGSLEYYIITFSQVLYPYPLYDYVILESFQ